MNNFLVIETSKNMRSLGRMAMDTQRNTAMLAVLIYGVAAMLPSAIISIMFHGTLGEQMSMLYTLLVMGPLTFGLAFMFLGIFRRQQAEVQQIFLGFEKFAKTLGLSLYVLLFIILWTMVFIIPGIIASFRYSQAYYIMIDHPEYTIRRCVDESKFRMKGNKEKYFLLSLSFIGWSLLCGIPSIIVGAMASSIQSFAVFQMLYIAAMIPYVWLVPYMNLTFVAFYEILVGNLRPEPADAQLFAPEPIDSEPIVESVVEPVVEPVDTQLPL